MNDEITIKPQVISPLKKICMTIGELPTSYLETMTYYEMLVWFTHFLRDNIIPVVNNNGEAVTELQNLFVELQTYVNNYFDNLDVQEEINNKLDAMVEAGTLQEIITDYLNSKAVFGYDTIADMKSSTNLIDGSYARTLGYYSKNDGGSGLYKIRQITNDDTIDEGSIIELNDNNLIAELIVENNQINIRQFGAKGDNTTLDDTPILNALNYCKNNNTKTLYFNIGTYKISQSIVLNNSLNDITITGENCRKSLITSSNIINFIDIQSGYRHTIKNIGFIGSGHTEGQTAIGKTSADNVYVARQRFEHLYFYGITYGINIFSGYFDSPILYDLMFETVDHCLKLKHCEGGTIQKIVAEPFVYTFAELFQCSACEIRDGIINGVPNNNNDNCGFILYGTTVNNYISGADVKISNIHSEEINQFALVLQPNTIFENIYIWNGSTELIQSRNTFDFGFMGGIGANNCSINNLTYWSNNEKTGSIVDFHTRTLSELSYTIPGTSRTLSLSIGGIKNLNIRNVTPVQRPFRVSIESTPAANTHNEYSIQGGQYTLKNGKLILDNFSDSQSDIPDNPDSLYGFNKANWGYQDKVTYLGLYCYSRSSQNSWFKYSNPVTS